MPRSHSSSFREQARFLRRQFLRDGALPLTDVLTEDVIARALTAVGDWLDRIFSPLVTLWVFLGQVLRADHSCGAAVARLIAHRLARGQKPCSPRTSAYCQARKRLPESFLSALARGTGQALDESADRRWLRKGRRVYVYDGSSVSMPDTRANQAAYPQPVAQKPGLGFPLARIMAHAAVEHGVEPRSIRFKGAAQTLEAFQPLIALRGEEGAAFRGAIYEQLLGAVAGHRVGDRPGRYEPRRRKRRPKPYDRLMKPRHEAKAVMLKGVRGM